MKFIQILVIVLALFACIASRRSRTRGPIYNKINGAVCAGKYTDEKGCDGSKVCKWDKNSCRISKKKLFFLGFNGLKKLVTFAIENKEYLQLAKEVVSRRKRLH